MTRDNVNKGPERENPFSSEPDKKDPAWDAFTKVFAMVAATIICTALLAILIIAAVKVCLLLVR